MGAERCLIDKAHKKNVYINIYGTLRQMNNFKAYCNVIIHHALYPTLYNIGYLGRYNIICAYSDV